MVGLEQQATLWSGAQPAGRHTLRGSSCRWDPAALSAYPRVAEVMWPGADPFTVTRSGRPRPGSSEMHPPGPPPVLAVMRSLRPRREGVVRTPAGVAAYGVGRQRQHGQNEARVTVVAEAFWSALDTGMELARDAQQGAGAGPTTTSLQKLTAQRRLPNGAIRLPARFSARLRFSSAPRAHPSGVSCDQSLRPSTSSLRGGVRATTAAAGARWPRRCSAGTYVPQVERGLQAELTGCNAVGP